MIGALFMVGEGLVPTGIANRIGDFLLHRSGGSEARLLVLLMLAVSLLGSLMRSASMALDVSGDLFFAQWLSKTSSNLATRSLQ